MAGPLADQIFEPMVNQPIWQTFAPLVGTGAGAGIGLLFVILGTTAMVISIMLYAIPMLRHMETTLPDYVVEPVVDENEMQPALAMGD